MSNDPIKDALKYDFGAHLLNEYAKGIYMKPNESGIVKIGSGTKKGTKKGTTKKKYGGTYKGKK